MKFWIFFSTGLLHFLYDAFGLVSDWFHQFSRTVHVIEKAELFNDLRLVFLFSLYFVDVKHILVEN